MSWASLKWNDRHNGMQMPHLMHCQLTVNQAPHAHCINAMSTARQTTFSLVV